MNQPSKQNNQAIAHFPYVIILLQDDITNKFELPIHHSLYHRPLMEGFRKHFCGEFSFLKTYYKTLFEAIFYPGTIVFYILDEGGVKNVV